MVLQLNKTTNPIESQWIKGMFLVFERICWMCGTKDHITSHHVISKVFKPKKNLLIPLCRTCHDRIHFISPPEKKKDKKRKQLILRKHVSKLESTSNKLLDKEL